MMYTSFLAGIALVAAVFSSALAESYSVLLNPVIQSEARGSYLSAPFDFAVEFSHVDTVKLTFVMPDGYVGTAFTTGNSFYFRDLVLLVHDLSSPLGSLYDIYDYYSPTALVNAVGGVSPNTLGEFGFGRPYITFPGDPPPELTWPDFIFSGRGNVSFIDSHETGLNLLSPIRTADDERMSWLPPGNILSARLTIEGTAAPEPGAMLLAGIGTLTAYARRGKRGKVVR